LPPVPDGHYCPHVSRARSLTTALFLALALALGCGSALAAETTSITEQIFGDYVADNDFDRHYAAADLQRAITVAREAGAGFEEFEAAVQETYDRNLGGFDTGGPPSAVDSSADDGLGLLPEPRSPGERDQPPWPLLVMAALGAMLMVSGAGSSIYRRVHR
jgi:hypothetical protein